MNALRRPFTGNYDVALTWLAAFALIATVPLLFLKQVNSIYTVAAVAGAVGSMLYLPLRNQLASIARAPVASDKTLLVSLIFLVAGVVAFFTRSSQYEKPTAYYVLMAISVAAAFVASVSSTGGRTYYILGIILLVGVLHIWTDNLMFPDSLIGLDPWTHMRVTVEELGAADKYGINRLTVQTIGGYYSLMHLYLRAVMTAFDVSYKWASLLFVGTPQVIGIIALTYALGREMISVRAGLVAALVVANAGWVLFFGEWVIPNGSGPLMVLLAAYLYLRAWRTREMWMAWLTIGVLAIALPTHFLSSLWVVGVLVCLGVALAIEQARRADLAPGHRVQFAAIPLVAALVLLGWWTFTTNGNAVNATTAAMQVPTPSITTPSIPTPAVVAIEAPQSTGASTSVEPPVSIPPIMFAPNVQERLDTRRTPGNLPELIMGGLGALLFFGLAIPGLLSMVRRSWKHRAWLVVGVGATVIGTIPALVGIVVLDDRWRYLAQVLLAVPLALTLIALWSASKPAATVCVAVVVFFSAIGLPANITNGILFPNLVVRYALTRGEMEGVTVAEQRAPPSLGSDSVYVAFIRSSTERHYSGRTKITSIDNNVLTGNFQDAPSAILLRDALYQEPFAYGSGAVYRIGYNPVDAARGQGYTDVWSNGEIHLLLRNEDGSGQ